MIGTPRVHRRLVDSTNELARSLAAAGAPHGTLVTAGEQSAGRGRQGRPWSAPPGSSVLMSVVLRDLREALPLAAAVAVSRALPVPSTIKWPNDIWIEGRKVAGILVEGRPQEGWAVLGVGLNVLTEDFPEELRESATSLRLAGADAGVEEMVAAIAASLEDWLTRPAGEVLEAWQELDGLRGRSVSWNGGEGVASGVDEGGALLVRTAAGMVALDAGEVRLKKQQ
jgi:BirA family biotin operon repressor/biotin-[acetyl-CoA-carboxylase] ligase